MPILLDLIWPAGKGFNTEVCGHGVSIWNGESRKDSFARHVPASDAAVFVLREPIPHAGMDIFSITQAKFKCELSGNMIKWWQCDLFP